MGQSDITVISADLSELSMLVTKLRAVGESDEATMAAGALGNLAIDADNRVVIAKEEGVLAALVTMLRDGTATGKIMAGGAVKLLSENQDAKVALLELGCDASALT